MDKEDRIEDQIKSIKHEFMRYKNGIVSDLLRRSGLPYKLIYGLQLPQITQIASNLEASKGLAHKLWNEENIRECRLIACMLFPKNEMDLESAYQLLTSIKTNEEAEILSFKLLRFLNEAPALLEKIKTNQDQLSPKSVYCGELLEKHLEAMKRI